MGLAPKVVRRSLALALATQLPRQSGAKKRSLIGRRGQQPGSFTPCQQSLHDVHDSWLAPKLSLFFAVYDICTLKAFTMSLSDEAPMDG